MRTCHFLLFLLAAAIPAAAGRSTDSLYFKVYQSPNLWRTDKEGNGLVSDRSFNWLDDQTGPCMDPAGSYIYEVDGYTLRRHDAATGSHADYTLDHSARSQSCGTDGEHIYYGWTARRYSKVTLTGTEVSVTDLGSYYACYHGIGVARDTLWIVDSDFAPLNYRGYPCAEFTGDTAQYYSTIHNPLVSVGIGMPICWDGERYFAACGGYDSSPLLWWDAEHGFTDSTMLPLDIRTVMTPRLPTAVAEPSEPIPGRAAPHTTFAFGVLNLAPASGAAQSGFVLLDACGRKVLELLPGENDVRRLSPGVYFVRQDETEGARRVIIQ
jgi:hypothetical protein